MGDLKDDLRRPGVELRETHISWAFLTENDVYKVKKPVRLDFLDFSTPERRRLACEAEIHLNRRMSPSVYLGVVPITRDRSGRHRIGGDGPPVDWAVHMKRLPDADQAAIRLAEGRLDEHHLERIASRVAEFHNSVEASSTAARYGTVSAIRGNVEDNFEQTGERILRYISREQAKEILAFQLRFLDERGPLFERRLATGRIRDGHGDLRLDHVYLDESEGIEILDCIEFNDLFRYGDVCADVAFLAMELAEKDHPDLAERFLALYAREADDYALYPLVDFYASYRAMVRGKIGVMQSSDDTRRYFLLALATNRPRLRPPFVLAIGGAIASGKTTLAAAVREAAAVPVIDSDRTRKSLLGVDPREPLLEQAWQGAYSPELTRRVYQELFHRAGSVLDSGRAVVLDASFRAREDRQAAERLASSRGIPFLFAECRAPKEILRERLRLRDDRQSVSDGRTELLDSFLERWEPVEELKVSKYILLDTARSEEETRTTLLEALPIRQPAPTKTIED